MVLRVKNRISHIFEDLRKIDKKLQISVATLFIFFLSLLISNSKYQIVSFFDDSISFSYLMKFFVYENFIIILSIFFLYYAITKTQFESKTEKESYLLSNTILIFIVFYISNFFFVRRLIELYPPHIRSFPSSFQEFLPFDWLTLEMGYRDVKDNFVSDFTIIGIIFSSISALAAFAFIITTGMALRSDVQNMWRRINLRFFIQELSSIKRRLAVSILIFSFGLLSIENVKASDYSTLRIEALLVQDDLVEFQEELSLANQNIFESEKYEARKVAAKKAYEDLADRDSRIRSMDLSFWSGEQQEIIEGLLEWLALWNTLLIEVSLDGSSKDETIFELNQKYKEIALAAESLAPAFASSWVIDFWKQEFVPLIR